MNYRPQHSCQTLLQYQLDFLYEIIEATIDAGAKTINIPDTVGYNLPHQFGDLIRNIIAN